MIMQFLSDYGYWIVLPLMILEGPIVTLIAAFMASIGIFGVVPVLILSILGDVLGDILFYFFGRKYGMTFVERFGKYLGITKKLVIRMEKYFVDHGGKTIFLVKSTTGLCWTTFIAAGIVRMDFKKFLFYSLLGGVMWSSFLVTGGYFFGFLYEQIAQTITYAGWVIFFLVAAFIVGVNMIKKYESHHFSEG